MLLILVLQNNMNLDKIIEDKFIMKYFAIYNKEKDIPATTTEFIYLFKKLISQHNELLIKKIEERQKLFNFIPQDKNGYKMVKTKDLDIINLIKNSK